MINSIAASKNTAISYFFEEFDTAELNSLRSTFVFPYAGQVLDALISSKRTFESKLFLEKAIEHNKKVQRKLQKKVKSAAKSFIVRPLITIIMTRHISAEKLGENTIFILKMDS